MKKYIFFLFCTVFFFPQKIFTVNHFIFKRLDFKNSKTETEKNNEIVNNNKFLNKNYLNKITIRKIQNVFKSNVYETEMKDLNSYKNYLFPYEEPISPPLTPIIENNKINLTGEISALSYRLTAEGPISKKKSAFIISGRSSYNNFYLIPFLNKKHIEATSNFYDINGKTLFRINKYNFLNFSGHLIRNTFLIPEDITANYYHDFSKIEWKHIFSNQLLSNLSVGYIDRDYKFFFDNTSVDFQSGVKNLYIKYNVEHDIDKNFRLYYKIRSIYHMFKPGFITRYENHIKLNNESTKTKNQYGINSIFLFESQHQLNPDLQFQYGIELNNFLKFNKDIIDSNKTKTNNLIFNDFGPRLGLFYLISNDESIELQYQRHVEYLHLIHSTCPPMRIDVWIPVSKNIKPQIFNRIRLGYLRNFSNNYLSMGIHAVYKKLYNQQHYVITPNTNVITNIKYLEDYIVPGSSNAYDIEFNMKKNRGDITGLINYKFSYFKRKIFTNSKVQYSDNRQWYPSKATYLNHNLFINSNYKLNNFVTLSANFSLSSGDQTNTPTGQDLFNNLVIPNIQTEYHSLVPPLSCFHHLDISVKINPMQQKYKKWKDELVFSIYNIYNNRKVTFIFFEQEKSNKNISNQLSIYGIIPSISYNFKF